MQTAGLKLFSQKIAFPSYINDLWNLRISGDRRTEVMVLKERNDWRISTQELTDIFIRHLNALLVSLLLITVYPKAWIVSWVQRWLWQCSSNALSSRILKTPLWKFWQVQQNQGGENLNSFYHLKHAYM